MGGHLVALLSGIFRHKEEEEFNFVVHLTGKRSSCYAMGDLNMARETGKN